MYRELLRLRPDYPEAHNNLAITCAKMGRPADAATSFLDAVRLRPNYAEAHNNLGIALAEQGKLDEAIARYQESLRLKPDYPGALQAGLPRGALQPGHRLGSAGQAR